MTEPRILFLDIETTPTLAYVWGLYDQNISLAQVVEPTKMLSFAARWYGGTQTQFFADWDDYYMVLEAWSLLDQADAVVTWNGNSFDQKHLHREFLEEGLGPVSPYQTVDLLLEVRRNFRFLSNKLDFVSQRILDDKKVSHTGFQLWLDCMAGDPKAQRLMKKYNKQDVDLMVPLYEKLLPWLKSVPNHNHWSENVGLVCPRCGSDSYHKRGVKRTQATEWQQYQCNNCTGYFRQKRSTRTVDGRV